MENPQQLDKFMRFHPCCINFLLEWTRNDQEWLTHSQFTTFTATCKATLVCIRGDHGTNTSVSESSHNHPSQKKTKGSTGQLFRQPFANLSNFCVLDCFALCDRCQFHPIYIYIYPVSWAPELSLWLPGNDTISVGPRKESEWGTGRMSHVVKTQDPGFVRSQELNS